jgi:glutathione S-transferase
LAPARLRLTPSIGSSLQAGEETLLYRLISATPSPYARKVRIALAEKGIPFELLTEVPWNADTATPRYNPLEKLPVLIVDEETSVYESRFILEWLEAKHPEPALMPGDPEASLAAKRFEVLGDGVCDACVLMFWERARAPERQSPEWSARQARKVAGGLREMSRLLGDSEFCVGEAFSVADIAVGVTVRYLDVRFPENDWRSRHPNLAAFSDRIEQRPSFAATVPTAQTIRDTVV